MTMSKARADKLVDEYVEGINVSHLLHLSDIEIHCLSGLLGIICSQEESSDTLEILKGVRIKANKMFNKQTMFNTSSSEAERIARGNLGEVEERDIVYLKSSKVIFEILKSDDLVYFHHIPIVDDKITLPLKDVILALSTNYRAEYINNIDKVVYDIKTSVIEIYPVPLRAQPDTIPAVGCCTLGILGAFHHYLSRISTGITYSLDRQVIHNNDFTIAKMKETADIDDIEKKVTT